MVFAGKCPLDKRIICGVVKDTGNCPYVNAEQCKGETTTNFIGLISETFGSITLKPMRYNHLKIKASILDNKCDNCGVIWGNSNPCEICKVEIWL